MQNKILNKRLVTSIVNLARFAPSVHNSQPWKIDINEGKVVVTLDQNYLLSDGDPTGRQSIISLGIFIQAFEVSANSLGYKISGLEFEANEARFSLQRAKRTDKNLKNLIRRVTDRSIYKPVNVPKGLIRVLDSQAIKDIKVWVVDDKEKINHIAKLTGKGIGLALSNPLFRKELSRHLVTPLSGKKRGISVKSLYIPKIIAYLEPVLMRLGIGSKQEVKLEVKRWKSASAVVVITSRGDLPKHWFDAGRTYMRTALSIQDYGLSQAASAAIVEASNFHEDVEEMLGTKDRIQAIIRIGKGSRKKYHSPRVSSDQLIA